ncbi:right-handed parallel beta-helix repeat-containing protein [Neolewinella persica]|uniref:right-handed parallel beta-helix repeat-containing protein n=1 Tax=Neolewinella persica TaxID=70998 RepID=UPI00036D713D|nr:right-handed parallel beta-helix repeat-containing protein [Neolewinella persica]
MKLSLQFSGFFAVLLILLFASCEVDTQFVTGDAVQIRFSQDTVAFDTVFTARGSATRQFKVYNDQDQPVKIDRITVDGETGVNFIFNVDGTRGPEANDVVIWGNDSIFVFVEVEVDPTEPEETSPFIAEDRLVFEMGNVREDVVLLAFGQNANYINGFNRGVPFRITCANGIATLPVDLPTVIYGSMFIDSCIVQALPGTRIYFHGGVQRNDVQFGGFFNDGFIFTQPNGSLQLLGTLEDPVIVRTDRLESAFAESTSKYRGLILGPGSTDNRLEHTQLLNAIVGITIDSAAEVTVENSIIAYSGGPAISAYQSDVTVSNSVFHSNSGNAIQFVKGGNLMMDHTTIANYGVDASGLVLTNFSCDDSGQICIAAPMVADIRNSIISGSRGSELGLLDIFAGMEPAQFRVRIDNSIVRTDQGFLDSQDGLFADFYESICNGCINLTFNDPLFQSIEQDNYQLDSLSLARDLGEFLPAFPIDLLGVDRDTDSPDAGAYERVDR